MQLYIVSCYTIHKLEPEFYGDLECKLKTVVSPKKFSAAYKIISHFIPYIYCKRQHASWSNQSQLVNLHSSLIAHWRARHQTL